MNIQFAVKSGRQIRLRSGSQSAGQPHGAVRVQGDGPQHGTGGSTGDGGRTLLEQGITEEPEPAYVSVKEAVFPFAKFPGVDIVLGPEMRSTGEVMGIAMNSRRRSPRARWRRPAGCRTAGRRSSAWRPATHAVVPIARRPGRPGLQAAGHRRHFAGPARTGDRRRGAAQDPRGRPNARLPGEWLDRSDREYAHQRQGRAPTRAVSAGAVSHGVPCITTITSTGPPSRMERMRAGPLEVYALQDLLGMASPRPV